MDSYEKNETSPKRPAHFSADRRRNTDMPACGNGFRRNAQGGSTPSLGKELHDATGEKVVFIQAAACATGMHEWVKDPENYTCSCSNNGNGQLYKKAVRNYLKSYYALREQYNVISTGYYWNQGEHEEVYAKNGNTVHDAESYYNAYIGMHNSITADCELDFGSKTVDITNADNLKLHFAVEPLDTYYMYDISYADSNGFSSDFFEIDSTAIT